MENEHEELAISLEIMPRIVPNVYKFFVATTKKIKNLCKKCIFSLLQNTTNK